VPVDQWKIAGSYIESSSSTMGAHVDVMWGMAVLQIPMHDDPPIDAKAVERMGRRVQFRRLSNATRILATR
jgi:hypothetical protein